MTIKPKQQRAETCASMAANIALAPELRGTACAFYDSKEALRYSTCTQTLQLQRELTQAAIQLLHLPASPQFLLDLGCGSGLSGAVLSEMGHTWVGCDLSPDMLCLAQGSVAEPPTQHPSNQEDNLSSVKSLSSRSGYNKLNHRHFNPNLAMHQSSTSKGLVFRSDMAQGIPLRAASIDGVVSISAVQWLCYLPNPRPALARLFRDLHRCLKPGCKAVLQVYLAGNSHVDLLLSSATAEGFSGGLYVGFPHKGSAKKYFFCLSKGSSPTCEGQVWSQACPLALPLHCGCTWQ